MSPNLPSTGLQVEALREEYPPENEHEYAQKYGRLLKHSSMKERASARPWSVLLVAAVIITLAVLVLF